MKKLIIPLLCLALLSGCAARGMAQNTQENNTNSNNSSTTALSTTIPESTTSPTAEAVAGLDSLSTSKVVWGFGKIENHAQPQEPKGLQNTFGKYGASWLLGDEKKIALTFDEGYENGFTPAILDTLKEKNVKAVFFVTYDFARDNDELIKRMINEGHTVGNHSYHHYSMDELDTETAKEEIAFLHNYIQENYNYTMRYFRFPKGEFSEQSLKIAQDLGYESIFWSYAYADWDPDSQPEATKAFTDICEATHPGEILLLHAVSKTNSEILGKVIDDIIHQGYEFTTEIS
ncbi:MAG: polysaccharide deacetylase family protein [Eubacterium sp.]|nr:polysaccharide deacetylase family protein [Eubacterium sp.]